MSDERLPELFDEASALDPEGRRRLLERVRAESPALADELARLLAAPAAAPSPIDAAPALPAAGTFDDVVEPPERIGPYRLLEQIGKGGMGRVFLAEQSTPDFTRKVALKLIDRPGPDPEAVRRFRDEVRILASLEHPWIVRFLDGGRSPEGIWFLALEYVEGEDLVSHARNNDLDVDARVRLVMAVAEAVAWAHERGVVHRDLKPGNVLVGRDGRPRLLDFGISKLLEPGGDVNLTTTAHGARLLTPAYASPEQLGGRPVTPASDVYSLGVILYELLAGTRPTTATGDGTAPASPEPPSTAARRLAATGERPPSGSPGRRRSGRRISRDLDAICLQALCHDPAGRYADAGGLLADLRRYLDREPVAARRHGLAFRFTPRRRGQRAALVATLVGLGLAGGAYYLLDRPAASSADPAPRSAGFPFDPVNPPAIAESERRFAEAPDDLVAGAALALGLARERRFDEARLVVGRLRQVPGSEAEPLVDFTEGRVALLSGENQRALVFLGRALERATAAGRTELVATIRQARGALLTVLGQREAGRAELERAREEAVRSDEPLVLFRALNEIAVDEIQHGEIARGEAAFAAALEAARRAGLTPIIVLSNLAEVRLLLGRPDLAEPLAREALTERARFPSAHREGEERTRLFFVLRDLGRAAEAEPEIERALELLRASDNALNRSVALYARAQSDLDDGRLGEIESLAVELESAAHQSSRRRPLGFGQLVRAQLAGLAGETDAARERFADARRLFEVEGDADLVAQTSLLAAESAAAAGDDAAAAAWLDQGLGPFAAASATLPARRAELLRVRLEARAGRLEPARRRLADAGVGLEDSPSVSGRLAFLRARAELAEAEGLLDPARADLAAAIALAAAAGWRVAELELGLELATLDGEAPDTGRLVEIRREATRLGLGALAARADSAALRRAGDPRG